MCISVQVLYISSTFRTDYYCLTVNKDLNDFRRIYGYMNGTVRGVYYV